MSFVLEKISNEDQVLPEVQEAQKMCRTRLFDRIVDRERGISFFCLTMGGGQNVRCLENIYCTGKGCLCWLRHFTTECPLKDLEG